MVNRPTSPIDALECVRLHKEGKGTTEIARLMGCYPPAIYRAFRRVGYDYRFKMRMGRPCGEVRVKAEEPPVYDPAKLDERLFPPPAGGASVAISHDAKKIEAAAKAGDREPCTYCGVRGDIGCRHKRRWAA